VCRCFEARAAGADAVLLIVAALDQEQLVTLQRRAWDLGLATLVEVHDDAELTRAIDSGARLIGVNNRNLRTLAVDAAASERLIERIPGDAIAISESGFKTSDDLARMRALGYRAFLVGERLMTSPEPGGELRRMLEPFADGGSRFGERTTPC
jgi:indole-3-glycerol phosphate synthase